MSLPLMFYVLMAAVRDRLILALLLMYVIGASLSLFFGSAAIIEKDQFTAIYAAGALRMIGVMGLVLFVIFFIRRSFDGKEVEFLLSRPISRLQLMLSLCLSFVILSIAMSLAIAFSLFALSPKAFGYGHILWIISVGMENIIMVSTAMFFAMYIPSATSAAMATLGFYVLARMMGQLLGIVDSPLVPDYSLPSILVQFVSVFMPRLDLYGQTSWLLYGVSADYGLTFVLLQGVVFTLLIISATLFDFVRRQF